MLFIDICIKDFRKLGKGFNWSKIENFINILYFIVRLLLLVL